MSLSENAKKEISRKFELPERQSKIATMIRQNDQLYCICRTTDSTSFMIGCDSCEEWYHGHCIGISQNESRNIKHYYCDACIENSPALKIEYKKKNPIPTAAGLAAPKDKNASYPHSSRYDLTRDSNSSSPLTPRKSKSSRPFPRVSATPSSIIRDGDTQRCRVCKACRRKENCGRCDWCIAYAFAGSRTRQLCMKRQCTHPIQRERNDCDEYSAAISQETADSPTPSSISPPLHQDMGEDDDDDVYWEDQFESPKKHASSKRPKNSSARKRSKYREKRAKYYASDSSDGDYGVEEDERDGQGEEFEVDEEDDKARQCYGPSCTRAARKDSKYCSDDCGIKLASRRIYSILPPRIQEYTMTPCVAEMHNRRELDENYSKRLTTKRDLEKLEEQRSALDEHIANVRGVEVEEGHEEDELDEEGLMHCITCGHEVPIKSCMKHMEKCYKKSESQTSFGSVYKTNVDGPPLFCDYLSLDGTYCKRLKVLCPEHGKDPKVGNKEICGFQLVDGELNPNGDYCRYPKKRCNTHFGWEKIARALIDMERVRQLLKMDDLDLEERQLRSAMDNRAGVVALLMNSTFDHELSGRMQRMQREEEARQQERYRSVMD